MTQQATLSANPTHIIVGQLRSKEVTKLLEKLRDITKEASPDTLVLRLHENTMAMLVQSANGKLVDSLENLHDVVKNMTHIVLPVLWLVSVDVESLAKAMEDIIECAGAELVIPLLFRLGYIYGRELTKKLQTGETILDKVRLMLEFLKASGFFKDYSILQLSAKRIEIIAKVASTYVPLLHIVRGIIAGTVSAIFEKAFTCDVKLLHGDLVILTAYPYAIGKPSPS